MKKLILIEGLPGTGKTTIAKWLSGILTSFGEKVTLLNEGDERIPCDFYNTSGIPKIEFESLLAQNPSEREILLKIALITDNYVYLRLDKCPDYITEKIKQWDMGEESNQFITVSDYIPCALERLEHWVNSQVGNSATIIIDSGYLQNPVNELLFRNAQNDEVRVFINSITNVLKPLNPACIYLRRDNAEQAITFAKMVKGKGWAERIDKLLQQNGHEDLFQRRFKLELELLENVEHLICHVYDDNWEAAKKEIRDYFAV
ncbi:MAG: hypothetical protein FWF05_09245 [Oscillospiraceae bacterium]|nr:hypothetical protein [Oscillospiraceae bacterium]